MQLHEMLVKLAGQEEVSEKDIADLLGALHVVMQVNYRGLHGNERKGEWLHIAWDIRFSLLPVNVPTAHYLSQSATPHDLAIAFKTGIGFRVADSHKITPLELVERARSPQTARRPLAYDVLYSMMLEHDSLDGDISFEQWARDLGFDPTSSESETLYQECRANARNFVRFFTAVCAASHCQMADLMAILAKIQ